MRPRELLIVSSAFGPTAESCLRPHCRRLKANRRRGRPRYRLRQSRRHGEAANPAAAPTPPHSQCAAQPAPSAAAAQPLPALGSALASPSAGSAPAAEPAAAAIRRWPPPPWASLDASEMQEARSVTRLPAPHACALPPRAASPTRAPPPSHGRRTRGGPDPSSRRAAVAHRHQLSRHRSRRRQPPPPLPEVRPRDAY